MACLSMLLCSGIVTVGHRAPILSGVTGMLPRSPLDSAAAILLGASFTLFIATVGVLPIIPTSGGARDGASACWGRRPYSGMSELLGALGFMSWLFCSLLFTALPFGCCGTAVLQPARVQTLQLDLSVSDLQDGLPAS